MFPWYVFFNQEKFGVRAMKFEGGGVPSTGAMPVGQQPQRIGAPMDVEDIPTTQLDLFATGTLPDDKDGEAAKRSPASTSSRSRATTPSSGSSTSPTAAP